ncbi:MAG: hypothetical protein K9G11_01090 [Rickettsiaceae bacterium]|nr:hypothetical protein [Rickettsiaceae bacterium]
MKRKYKEYLTKILEFNHLTLLVLLLLTSCSLKDQNLRHSGNNKIIDSNKSSMSKRQLYQNTQYIRKAKTNIINQNYEDDEDESTMSIEYRKMYEKMIKEDTLKKQKRDSLGNTDVIKQRASAQNSKNLKNTNGKIFEKYATGNSNDSPKAAENIKNNDVVNKSEADLQQQLLETKKLLDQTQQELAKSKCKLPPPDENSNSKLFSSNNSYNDIKHGAACSLPPEY